jgi:hypothetical protein
MKTNLLKVIKFKNTKLKIKIEQLDFLTASIDIGYNKSFTKKHMELHNLKADENRDYSVSHIRELIEPDELIVYKDIIKEDLIKQKSKVNNSNNLFKLVTKAPLLKSHHVLSLNDSIMGILLQRFNAIFKYYIKCYSKTRLMNHTSLFRTIRLSKKRYQVKNNLIMFYSPPKIYTSWVRPEKIKGKRRKRGFLTEFPIPLRKMECMRFMGPRQSHGKSRRFSRKTFFTLPRFTD